jgi:hypothetical protein
MGVEDHQAAHEQDQDDGRVESVPNPSRQPVSVDDLLRGGCRLHDAPFAIDIRHS